MNIGSLLKNSRWSYSISASSSPVVWDTVCSSATARLAITLRLATVSCALSAFIRLVSVLIYQ